MSPRSLVEEEEEGEKEEEEEEEGEGKEEMEEEVSPRNLAVSGGRGAATPGQAAPARTTSTALSSV